MPTTGGTPDVVSRAALAVGIDKAALEHVGLFNQHMLVIG